MSAPNWLGLLRWTMSHSDGTSDSSYARMSAEDKEWLERVMKEAVRDDPQRMNEIMIYIKDLLHKGVVLSSEQEGEFETNLEDLRDIVEQIDMAQVFVKFGGAVVLVDVISSAFISHDIQALSAAVLATITQNNLVAQESLFQQRLVDRLMEVFLRTSSFVVATKVLLAMSSLSRGHGAAEEYFVLNFAAMVVDRCLDAAANNLLSRLFFFLNALIMSDSASEQRAELLVNLVLPRTLAIFLSDLSIDARDNLSQLYSSILKKRRTSEAVKAHLIEQLESAIDQRESYLSGACDVEEDDKKVELQAIASLRNSIRNVDQSSDTHSHLNASGSDISNSHNTSNAEEETSTVFMIAPPPLEASSSIP